jgi:hypothetical protein
VKAVPEQGCNQIFQVPVRIMNRDGYRLVGEGDGGISPSDWGQPIANCPGLLSIHDDCESCGYEFPVGDLSEFLLDRNLLRQPLTDEVGSDLIHLLEALLGDDIDIHREHYDHNMPGASGVYYHVYLRGERTGAAESSLKVVEEFIDRWRQLSGLALAVKAQVDEKVAKKARAEGERRASERHALERQSLAAQQWEEELFQQIQQSLLSAPPSAFARLHFMLYRGRVFFLEKQGWWHSIGGDPLRVLEKLDRVGVPVTKVKVRSSSKGWVPHFGRTRPEERGFGWYDPIIQLDGGAVEIDALIVEARSTLKP